VRNQVTTLPVHLDPQQQDYTAALDAAAEAAKLAGHPVAALMFTHPANPQGTLFSRQQLCSMIQWCLRNKVHCIRWVGGVVGGWCVECCLYVHQVAVEHQTAALDAAAEPLQQGALHQVLVWCCACATACIELHHVSIGSGQGKQAPHSSSNARQQQRQRSLQGTPWQC
jgi:hypothetical protein